MVLCTLEAKISDLHLSEFSLQVGDCSEMAVLGFRSSLLVINQVLRIIKNAVKSDVKTGRI